jgi:ABC-type Fe3+ transport system permease subunit
VGIRDEVILDIICFITLSLSRILLSLNYVSHYKSLAISEGRPYKGLYLACSVSISLLFLFSFIPYVNIIVVGNVDSVTDPLHLFTTHYAFA